MTTKQWLLAEDLTKVLEPFEAVYVRWLLFNAVANSSIDQFIEKQLFAIDNRIYSWFRVWVGTWGKRYKKKSPKFCWTLNSRFLKAIQSDDDVFILSSYFDPRYKATRSGFSNEEFGVCKQHIRAEFAKCDSTETDQNKSNKKSMVEYLFPEEKSVLKEFEKYKLEPLIGKNDTVYLWWNANQNRFPVLSSMAKIYISIPATYTPSERVFSTACSIVSAKGSNLIPENVNKLFFCIKKGFKFFWNSFKVTFSWIE